MLADELDTIVAQATPVGEGAIGIIRLSGPSSVEILSKIFKGSVVPSQFKSHRLYFGKICQPDLPDTGTPSVTGPVPPHPQSTASMSTASRLKSEVSGLHLQALIGGPPVGPPIIEGVIDEILAVWMKKPHSYTGEDVVEIQGHGGPVVLQRIVRLIVDLGARLAEPGEFSKRAFLNGKMDLSQAEGIANLISAQTEWQAQNALLEMGGFLKRTIQDFEKKILELMSRLEVGFDFVEEDVQLFDRKWGLKGLTEIKQEIKKLIDSFETGQFMKEGLRIVLVGKPNVGKSSLLNVLLNEDRAIVHEEPGTTRDILSGERKIQGVLATFYDTAGIRKNSSEVEREGIKRSEEWIKKADLLLCLLDSSSPLTEEDDHLLEQTRLKPRIIIYSKSDLPPAWDLQPFSDGWPDWGPPNERLQMEPINPNFSRKSFSTSKPSIGGAKPQLICGAQHTIGMRRTQMMGQDPSLKGCWVSVSAKERRGIDELINTIYDVSIKSKILCDHNYVLNNVHHKKCLDGVYFKLSGVIESLEKESLTEECLVEELRIMLDELKGITGEITNEKVLSEIFSKFCIGK